MGKFLSISWHVLINVIALAVQGAMFNIAATPFENVVVAVLVAIYVSISGSRLMLFEALQRSELAGFARFIELREAMGKPAKDEEKESLRDLSVEVNHRRPGHYINIGGLGLMGLWATWHLIATVV